ncbi:FecR family protein [Dyadobacter luteus]|uniref:FecR family protein n=1 Tax=Dyadobacter luteus TaxID=2259619 RepID=A0A3D8YBD8_9BACT|nr:FecR family protein [Dyadobacter luteus]REA61308.1 FecR family protein [Dyadobacter luteus]
MKYDQYSLTELIRNDDFIAWVRHPDEASEARWQEFLKNNPEKRSVVEDARGYVNLVAEDTGKHKPTTEQSRKMWSVVESHMADDAEEEVSVAEEKTINSWQWARIAASVVLIAGFGVAVYWYQHKPSQVAIVNANVEVGTISDVIEKVNDSDKPMTILLEDGSSVVLEPAGKLSFFVKSTTAKREVSLRGKAFFEIVKDKKRPFIVYTDGLATKVLGTSFLIDAPENGSEIKVEVKTGQVSVFPLSLNASEKEKEAFSKPELTGTILNRDEKIAFSKVNGKTIKLQDTPRVVNVTTDIADQLFIFDETPASEVFKALESAYNIKIVYKESLISNCPLNATLVGQSFTEKLTAICIALDAQYEIRDDHVIISGKGCK